MPRFLKGAGVFVGGDDTCVVGSISLRCHIQVIAPISNATACPLVLQSWAENVVLPLSGVASCAS